MGHQNWLRANFKLLPTSGNDDEDRLAAMRTRFGFAREKGFRPLARQECSCSDQCVCGLDGSKQGTRAQAAEDEIRLAE